MPETHIIGAGVAGLACAVRLARNGHRVTLYEAAPQAGGRCRSYYDEKLERTVDNGNHVILSANRSALAFLEESGGRETLSAPPGACFPFVDLATSERWTLRPTDGAIPWWIAIPGRRVAGAGLWSHLRAGTILNAKKQDTVAELLRRQDGRIWERLWKPFTIAILNTEPERASAWLLRRVMESTLARGGRYCLPLIPVKSLSHSFVDPAIATLERAGAAIRFNRRLRGLSGGALGITRLDFADGSVELTGDDRVVLAVPAHTAARLLPGLKVPRETRSIVNAHIRLPHRARLAEGIPFLGMVGGTAEWLFLRDDVASVTVSAANNLVDRPSSEIAEILWRDCARALSLDTRLQPPMRVIKERRATIAQTPESLRERPRAEGRIPNLLLAGDWTDTGLPPTLEGAALSGHTAADLILRCARKGC